MCLKLSEPVGDMDPIMEEKRRAGSGMRPMPFPCNGYDNIPRCLNGGKGPRKTWTKSGRFCVCLCPPKWVGPECGFAANNMQSKRFTWGLQKFCGSFFVKKVSVVSSHFCFISSECHFFCICIGHDKRLREEYVKKIAFWSKLSTRSYFSC